MKVIIMPNNEKTCFIIGPFGIEGSETRDISDVLMEEVEVLAKAAGYQKVFRTLDDPTPGPVTRQIFHNLASADLVIADLSGFNPNVFYELALRHCTGKPVIHISDSSDKVPFDIASMSVIRRRLLKNKAQFKKELKKQIENVQGSLSGFEEFAESMNPMHEIYPDGQGYAASRWFDWQLQYDNNLYKNWLGRQDSELKDCIKSHNPRLGPEYLPEKEAIREGIAEYWAYKSASTQDLLQGSLSYLLDIKNRSILGWAIGGIPGGSDRQTIPVSGFERGTGDELEIELHFCQGSRQVNIALNYDQTIRNFNYKILFRKEPATNCYTGKFYHPDYVEEPRLLVGTSTLIQKT